MTTLIAICHGIFSNGESMGSLADGLRPASDGVFVYDYDWHRVSVLTSGIQLAQRLVSENRPELTSIILVGHSQGGLVCRVAAAALKDPDGIRTGLRKAKFIGDASYKEQAFEELEQLRSSAPEHVRRKLCGVATIATPNSGAFTFGQLSMTGRIVARGIRWIGEVTGQARNR